MSVDDESTSCYCLMDSHNCHLMLDQPGCYALVGEPVTDSAIKRLRIAVFGSMEASSMDFNLRVHCVDDTPHAFQVRAAQSTYAHITQIESHCWIPDVQMLFNFLHSERFFNNLNL